VLFKGKDRIQVISVGLWVDYVINEKIPETTGVFSYQFPLYVKFVILTDPRLISHYTSYLLNVSALNLPSPLPYSPQPTGTQFSVPLCFQHPSSGYPIAIANIFMICFAVIAISQLILSR
jgi:hypothetical protein